MRGFQPNLINTSATRGQWLKMFLDYPFGLKIKILDAFVDFIY